MKISADPLILFPVLTLALTDFDSLLPICLAVLLHESGHLSAALLLKIKITGIKLNLFGAKIETGSMISYQDEIILCAAGPFFNLMFFLVVLPFVSLCGYAMTFAFSSLLLCIFNLLPLPAFDGARILFCAVALIKSVNTADVTLRAAGLIPGFFLWIFSTYLMLRLASSLAIYVFSIALFARISIRDGYI